MAGTGVGKFSSTASNNTSNLTVNFAENMAPSNVNNAARELMGHMRDMYEQLGDGYFEFGDGDGTYTVARGDADTITLTSSADISSVYFPGRKIRITDGGANVVEGTIASSSHSSTTQTVNLTGISLASGTPTKVELGIDTAAFGGRVILDDDGDTYIEAATDDTIDIYVAGAKDFVITANTFTAESGSTIAAQALTATTVTASGIVKTDDTTNATSTTDGSLQTDGGLSVALDAVIGDDIKMLSDSSQIAWGADGEVTMTHVHNHGIAIQQDGNGDTLALISADADADSGPLLRFYRNSSSPAQNDVAGLVNFVARNNNSQDITLAQILSKIETTTDGSEDGDFKISTMNAGTLRERLALNSNATVFNEDSVDVDFRVESNGQTHMLFVDGGSDHVNIAGGGTDGGGVLNVFSADNTTTLSLIGTDTDASAGPILSLERSNNSAADSDDIGKIILKAQNDANQTVEYGIIRGDITDASDGTEDGVIKVEAITAGTNTEIARFGDGVGVVFNETSADIDFRVEGNGDTHLIFADAGDDDVYIGYYTGGDNDDAMLYVATDQNKEVAKLTAANGSYAEDVIHLDCTRAGSSNYNLIRATSNGNNDNELVLNGAGALSIDGTLTENGADYAEYFEWNDGNSSDEDRVGLSVKLSGNKIVASSSSDDAADIIGVISGNPAVVGDASWNTWNDKYEKDDYGRYVWEDYTVTEWTELADTLGGGKQTLQLKSYQTDKIPDGVTAPDADVTVDGVLTKTAKVIISKGAGGENLSRRKENSSWDATATYVPRAERKEWDAVGLVGKLRMKKGQKTGTNWLKMRDISDTVEEWLIR